MSLQFRKSQYIPNFVYQTLILPKTLEQCAYLIEQKHIELQSTKDRLNSLKFQKELLGNNAEDLDDCGDLESKMRSVRNAQATLCNQLILLNQWRKDFVNIAELPERKKKGYEIKGEVKELKVRIHELEQQVKSIKASNSLKRLACQVEQLVRYFVQFVFIQKPISPLQVLELQRITREISGREPDPNFFDLMKPFIEIAKSDREQRRKSANE